MRASSMNFPWRLLAFFSSFWMAAISAVFWFFIFRVIASPSCCVRRLTLSLSSISSCFCRLTNLSSFVFRSCSSSIANLSLSFCRRVRILSNSSCCVFNSMPWRSVIPKKVEPDLPTAIGAALALGIGCGVSFCTGSSLTGALKPSTSRTRLFFTNFANRWVFHRSKFAGKFMKLQIFLIHVRI